MNMIELVKEGIQLAAEEKGEWAEIRTYEEAGLMTFSEGLVVTLPDGSEYQLTIIKSR